MLRSFNLLPSNARSSLGATCCCGLWAGRTGDLVIAGMEFCVHSWLSLKSTLSRFTPKSEKDPQRAASEENQPRAVPIDERAIDLTSSMDVDMEWKWESWFADMNIDSGSDIF